jgi:hypothetical protein
VRILPLKHKRKKKKSVSSKEVQEYKVELSKRDFLICIIKEGIYLEDFCPLLGKLKLLALNSLLLTSPQRFDRGSCNY